MIEALVEMKAIEQEDHEIGREECVGKCNKTIVGKKLNKLTIEFNKIMIC